MQVLDASYRTPKRDSDELLLLHSPDLFDPPLGPKLSLKLFMQISHTLPEGFPVWNHVGATSLLQDVDTLLIQFFNLISGYLAALHRSVIKDLPLTLCQARPDLFRDIPACHGVYMVGG